MSLCMPQMGWKCGVIDFINLTRHTPYILLDSLLKNLVYKGFTQYFGVT